VKEKLKVFRLEDTDISARLDSRCKRPPSPAGSVLLYGGVGFDDGLYAVGGQPPDQLIAGVAYLLVPEKALGATLVLIRWTPEVQPADITTKGRSILGSIARHNTASYLNVNRNHHMIIIPLGRNSDPAFVAGPQWESRSPNISDLYAQHGQPASIFCIRNLILRIAARKSSVKL